MADHTSNFEPPGGHESAEHSAGDFHEAVRELCIRIVAAGVPYAWGGGVLDGPSQGVSDGGGYADECGDYDKIGFDSSGLARFVIYQTTGIEIPRTAAPQYDFCTPTDSPQIGDLGWPPGGNPGHVVIYVGDGQVCEAQQSGTNIMFSDDRGFVYGYVPGGPERPERQRRIISSLRWGGMSGFDSPGTRVVVLGLSLEVMLKLGFGSVNVLVVKCFPRIRGGVPAPPA